MSNTTETFDYNAVKTKMINLDNIFADFADILENVNMTINELLNVGPDSALYCQTGRNLLATWNNNASTFSDFKANFDKWSQLVTVVSMNNQNLEGELYRTLGNDMSGVAERVEKVREEMTFPDANYSATYTSILKNYKYADSSSLIATGAAYTMSQGTAVNINGETYYFYGVDMNSQFIYSKDPNFSADSQTYIVNCDSGKPTVKDNKSVKDIDFVSTTVRSVNHGLNISSYSATASDKDWIVSDEYVKATATKVNDTSDVSQAIADHSSFYLADDKTLKETHWKDTTSDSDVFYNPEADGLSAEYDDEGYRTVYYSDENNSGYIRSGEYLSGNHAQDAFAQAESRGNDDKSNLDGYDNFIEIE